MTALKRQVRGALLRHGNLRRVRDFAAGLPAGGDLIFIFTNPADLHFAPLAAAARSEAHRQVLVGNGLSDHDVTWLQERCRGVPILRLSASLIGNAASYLAHGELVDLLALTFAEPFFIQDADCFVLDGAFFQQLRTPAKGEYAAGPWWKSCPNWDQVLPDTFLVGVSPAALAENRKRYGVSAAIAGAAPRAARARLEKGGLSPAWRPELNYDKRYFDTLQLSWILSTLDGMCFGRNTGLTSMLHHVGGTSYLAAKPSQELTRSDWWPLNTCYTTLRILERPGWEGLRSRFVHLTERFGNAEQIVRDYPAFLDSRRFAETTRMMKVLYGAT
jgi:hypothetical protein